MSYQDLGAWAPGEDPGTLYGDPRLNQRARPGGKSYSIIFCAVNNCPAQKSANERFWVWKIIASNYCIPISNKHGADSRGIPCSKGCFPGV